MNRIFGPSNTSVRIDLAGPRQFATPAEEKAFDRCREIIDQVTTLADGVAAQHGGPLDRSRPNANRTLFDGRDGAQASSRQGMLKTDVSIVTANGSSAGFLHKSHVGFGLGTIESRTYTVSQPRPGACDTAWLSPALNQETVTVFSVGLQPVELRYSATPTGKVDLHSLMTSADSSYPGVTWSKPATPGSQALLG